MSSPGGETRPDQHVARLAILHEIDRAILTGARSPEAIAHVALRHLRTLLSAPRATLALYDLAAGEGTWIAVDSDGPTQLPPGNRFPLTLMGDLAALQRGDLQTVDLASLEDLWQARVAAEGVRVYVVVPLVVRGELIGSLNFGAREDAGVPAEQVPILREVADQLAIALQEARLHAQTHRHMAELEQRVADRTADVEAARLEAERANQAKTDFLSRMSHELRTPLNAVLGFAQLLEIEPLTTEQRESVDYILKAGRHLLGLIDEVLDISRIEAGRLSLSLEPIPLGEMIQEALELIRSLAATRNIRLAGAPPEPDDRCVLADRQRLKQVLLNLLSNAVKFNRPAGEVRVRVVDVGGDRHRVEVSDTGPGIPAEKMARLFTPFDRLGAEERGVEGTGLGLALCKRLVEAMRGTISVDSTVGQGSTFGVEFPRAASPAAGVVLPAVAPGEAPRTAGTVLYIEDNLPNLRLVERLLVHRPAVKLLPSMQGGLGVELAREHGPGLILLDLQLPDIPGTEVLERLRRDPRTSRIPVVVISADATPGQIHRLRSAGVREFLPKPLDVKRLLQILDEVLGPDVGS
jgi:signal transduction histidine kinase/ActR/RegA family two-component response regulator